LTDSSGRFVLETPGQPILLATRRIGILADTVAVAAERDTVTIFARPLAVRLAEVGVEAEVSPARARFDTLAQPNLVTLSPKDIVRAPGLLEPDVLRAVQLLPGTVARNDYSTGYNVRGGESDQNLVLLDGITVFNPSHLGGIFSTFDVNAVDRADFLTGGFPSEYSGRLSSVLDVTVRPGSHRGVHGSGGVSLLSSKLLMEAPIGPVSVLISGRRTYADQVIKAFSSDDLPYYFSDLMGKVDLPYRGGGDLSFTGYWGRDVFAPNLIAADSGRQAVDLRFDWGNRLGGFNWRQPIGKALLQQHVSVTEFRTGLDLSPNLVRFDNRARLWTGRTVLTLPRIASNDLKLGLSAERYDMNYSISNPSSEGAFTGDDRTAGGGTALLNRNYDPRVFSIFLHDQWWATHSFILRGGLRTERVTGANFTGISPRASFKLFLSGDHAFTGSVGRYYQAVQSERDQEIPISLYEFWVGASASVPVARSDHLVLGYEGWIAGGTQFSVEAYHKTFDHLITPNRALALRDSGDAFLPVNGTASGFDVLLRRHVGFIRGWVAYSFVRAIRNSEGMEFPPAHDRRHTINIVLQAPGPWHSDLGLRWGFGSPLPYTPLLGDWEHRTYSPTYGAYFGARDEPLGGDINSARYPYYSRLDIGLRWHGRKWGLAWEPYLQVVNAYNRRNVFTYFFDDGTTPPTRTAFFQLPILVTFGVDFSW
jgi:hypothetical protein